MPSKKNGKKRGKGGKAHSGRSREDRERKAAQRKERQKAQYRQPYTSQEDLLFAKQMAGTGLKIKVVKGDGACMFSALGDQKVGSDADAQMIRNEIMDYIEKEREFFSPFIEDDESFEDYIQRMRKRDEWGGHQELYAASQLWQVNIIVHQLSAPRLEILQENAAQSLHLSYHGESHYNSVRMEADNGDGPAEAILLAEASQANSSPPTGDDGSTVASSGSQACNGKVEEGKKKPRHKKGGACPCGSGLKYRKCCRSKDLSQEYTQKVAAREEALNDFLKKSLGALQI
ncbi:unnamed protein product [Chrysoparadoxa australica]